MAAITYALFKCMNIMPFTPPPPSTCRWRNTHIATPSIITQAARHPTRATNPVLRGSTSLVLQKIYSLSRVYCCCSQWATRGRFVVKEVIFRRCSMCYPVLENVAERHMRPGETRRNKTKGDETNTPFYSQSVFSVMFLR